MCSLKAPNRVSRAGKLLRHENKNSIFARGWMLNISET